MSITTIVVGLDGSDGAAQALAWCAELAADVGAEVVAVHAYSPIAELERAAPPIDFAALARDAEERLAGPWCEPLAAAGVAHRSRLVEDEAVAALVSVAAEESADLVVVGSHGETGWRERILGSVATELPGTLRVPVTIVPQQPPSP